MRLTVRIVVCGLAALAVFSATSASAQYKPYRPPTSVPGETWFVEFGFGTWSPPLDLTVSGASGGVGGPDLGVRGDLGLEGGLLKDWDFVIKPARRHKFRIRYQPSSYSASTVLAQTIVFNGQTFPAGTTVATSLDWTTWRLTYEYDFVSRPHGFAGFILGARYDDAGVTLGNTKLNERASVRTPFPMLGGIVRVYPLSDMSLTAEFTGMKLPTRVRSLTGYDGHAFDLDLYATFDFSRNFGARAGYRSSETYYEWVLNHFDLHRRGAYVMGIVRY